MSETEQRTAETVHGITPAVKARHDSLLERVIEQTVQSGFDAEAWHVMDQRDTRLIQDEIMGGARSSKFVYDFSIGGGAVRGISAVGARELASHYGKIRHRLVSSTRKIGKLFVFTTYAAPGVQPSMQTSVLPELEKEPDGYEAVCEVQDINSGNSMMAAKFESQFEWVGGKGPNDQGRWREKAHFATIAQSKAQRNGILMVIPQAIQLEWMESMKGIGKNEVITGSVLAEKRDGVLRYGAAQGVAINRDVLDTLLLDQIAGLSEAARTKNPGDFLASCIALGLIPPIPAEEPTRDSVKTAAASASRSRPAPVRAAETKPDPRANAPAGPTDAARQEGRQTSADGIPDDRWGDMPRQQQSSPVGGAPPKGAEGGPDQTIGQTGLGRTAGETPATFSEYLVDGEGKELPDGDDVIEPITDPVTFANTYADVRATMFPGDHELFDRANHDALAKAQATPGVAAIIAAARVKARATPAATSPDSPTLPMDMPIDPAAVFAPPEKPTAAHFKKYETDLKFVLDHSATAEALNHVIDVNSPTYDKFPGSRRLNCKALVEARQKELSPAPARGEPQETADQLAERLMVDIYSLVALESVDTWLAMPATDAAIKTLLAQSLGLHKKITDAIKAKRAEFVTPALPPIPDEPEASEARKLADQMLAKFEDCKTPADVVALGNNVDFIKDAQKLAGLERALWGEVSRAGNKKKAELEAAT